MKFKVVGGQLNGSLSISMQMIIPQIMIRIVLRAVSYATVGIPVYITLENWLENVRIISAPGSIKYKNYYLFSILCINVN